MIAIWNKQTRQIIEKTNDHTLEYNYRLKAQGKGLGFFSNPLASAFPEPGYEINSNGEYVVMSYQKRVQAKLVPALTPNQKLSLQNGVETPVEKTIQEKLNEGLLTLADICHARKNYLFSCAVLYLNSAKTANGYTCNDAAQKIALSSIQMKHISDSDEDKQRMTQQGLLYSLEKAREILDFCASVTASFRTACTAVDNALNASQIESINLESYL